MNTIQQRLDGTVPPKGTSLDDPNRSFRGALIFCEECGEYILLSQKPRHEHDLYNSGGVGGSVIIEEEDDEPTEVGGKYRVKKSYSVDVVEYVYAHTKRQAKQQFPSPSFGSDVTTADKVHMKASKVETIYEDDEEAEEYDLLP